MSTTTHTHRPWHEHDPKRVGLLLTGLAVALLAAVVVILATRTSPTPIGTGSGVAATEARSLPRFSGLKLTGDNNVVIRVGGPQSVIVHADSNLLQRVTTTVHAGQLVIGTTPGNLSAKSPMYVTVEVPTLNRLTLAGAGNLSVSGIHSPAVAIEIPGDGTITASGTATTLVAVVKGSGNAALAGLTARHVEATLSGEGNITVTATARLRATLLGTGSIVYHGRPTSVVTRDTGTGLIVPAD